MITLATRIPSHISVAGHRVLVSYDGQPMTCYDCNDMGHLYQACSMQRRLQETAPISTHTSWADIEVKGTGNTPQALEGEEGTAQHRGRPEPAGIDYEEHCTSYQSEERSEQFDENVQVEVTMQAVKCSTETPSIPAHPALVPEINVAVQRGGIGGKEGRYFASITSSTTQEISQKVQGREAGVLEVGVSMADSSLSLSDTESLNASQPASQKRPKKSRVERRGSRTRNRSRNGVRARLTQV